MKISIPVLPENDFSKNLFTLFIYLLLSLFENQALKFAYMQRTCQGFVVKISLIRFFIIQIYQYDETYGRSHYSNDNGWNHSIG